MEPLYAPRNPEPPNVLQIVALMALIYAVLYLFATTYG